MTTITAPQYDGTADLSEQDRDDLAPVLAVLGDAWLMDDWGHCNYVLTPASIRTAAADAPLFGASTHVVDVDGTDALRWMAGWDGIATEIGPVVSEGPHAAAAWIAEQHRTLPPTRH